MTVSPGWGAPPSWSSLAPGWGWPDPIVQQELVGVRLGGIDFATSDAAPGDVLYTLSRIRGWWESADDATEVTQHWSGDGDVAFEHRLAARTIEMRGLILARSLRDSLAGRASLAGVRSSVLGVAERSLGFSREASVRRLRVDFETLAPLVIGYTLTLQADDPLRYGSGAIALSNGANTLVNRGDATAYPVLDLVGPHSAITVAHAGGSWSFAALASGQSRTVDLRNGDVWNGDVRAFGAESGPAPVVPASGASWTISGLGTGTARARRTEAWT